MKKFTFLLTLVILITTSTHAQFETTVLEVPTNDLVYLSQTGKLYPSIKSYHPEGNSLGVISLIDIPYLESTLGLNSEPSKLAASDNGQYIYTGFSGAGLVKRIEVSNLNVDLQIQLGNSPNNGAHLVEDMEVMPNAPETIVISRKVQNSSPRYEGTVVYDNDVMRPIITNEHTGSNRIEFKNSGQLIGNNIETSGDDLYLLSILSNGIEETEEYDGLLGGNYRSDFILVGDYLCASTGEIFDISGNEPLLVGTIPDVSDPVTYDQYNNYLCFAVEVSGDIIELQRYDFNTLLLVDSIQVFDMEDRALSLVMCGEGCYAFNTDDFRVDGKLVIIKDPSVLSIDSIELDKMTLYPNPVSDSFMINNLSPERLEIFNMQGQKVAEFFTQEEYNISGFAAGIYIVKGESDGKFFQTKLIKN